MRIFYLLLLVPNLLWADDIRPYADLGLGLGGDRLLGFSRSSCSLFERAFGCSEADGTMYAGNAWELSLGVVYINSSPFSLKFSHSFSYISDSDANRGRITYRRPHSDFGLDLDIKGRKLGLGLSYYANTRFDLREWRIPNPFNGGMVEFKDSLGGYVEFKGKVERNMGAGIRWAYAEHKINTIDGVPVANGKTFKGDYISIFVFFTVM